MGYKKKGLECGFCFWGIVGRALLGRELARVFASVGRAVANHGKVPRQFRLFSDRLR
jgi:hypothetical protein